ncbi:MAG: (2Fe-2S)-binding protein [Deltaproteobacteria bacterium]|nr:(2Fe-2S)-binding protein [Deltaproteobacteria bacterium]
MIVNFVLNDQPVFVECSGSETLLSVLREPFGLLGVKEGCGIGECGACTVLLDERAVNACLVAVGKVQGRRVLTIEGLAKEGKLHPIQEAFVDLAAVQCGFCTPGMVLATYGLLKENPAPSRQEVIEGLAGNLCRCTGYHDIIRAVQKAAKQLRKG